MLADRAAADAAAVDERDSGWAAALDALEAEVERAHALADGGVVADEAPVWRPEAGLGPLPKSLAPRARQLLDAQAAAARRVTEASASSRRHLDVVATLRANGSQSPVYLDVEG